METASCLSWSCGRNELRNAITNSKSPRSSGGSDSTLAAGSGSSKCSSAPMSSPSSAKSKVEVASSASSSV
eukprot:1365463-Prymnesium_polylepis.1